MPKSSGEHKTPVVAEPFRYRWLVILAATAVVLIPLLQLLSPAHRPVRPDWESGLWSTAYTAAYFRHHGTFPVVFNTDSLIGHPVPVLYGPLLFPMTAMPSLALGAESGFRFAVVLVALLQFALAYRATWLASGDRMTAFVVAMLVNWAVYPLTNLYNRGAGAEFFATTFLVCAACAGVSALLEPATDGPAGRGARARRAAMTLLCGLCGAAAAGTHGITAMLGGTTLACLVPATLLLRSAPRQPIRYLHRLLIAVALALSVAVVLAPWLYAAAQFAGRLNVQYREMFYFPAYDSWAARLSPVPYDAGVPMFQGAPGIRFLDAQLSVGLIILLAGVVVRLAAGRSLLREGSRRHLPLLSVSLTLFIALLLLSVVPDFGRQLPSGISGTIQFAYRLVTYLNLTSLVALLCAFTMARDRCALQTSDAARSSSPRSQFGPAGRISIYVAAVIGLAAMGMKLSHASEAVAPIEEFAAAPDFNDEVAMLKFPRMYYGWRDYVVRDASRAVPADAEVAVVRLLPQTEEEYGEAGSVSGILPKDVWVVTNILAFPWNRVVVDGTPVPESQTLMSPEYLLAKIPAGTHTIGYHFDPPMTWVVLRTVSFAVLGAWIVATVIAFAVVAWFALRPTSPAPAS